MSILSVVTTATLFALAGSAYCAPLPFTLSSPDLDQGSFSHRNALNGFGCHGGNLSPQLHWTGLPAGTRSLALMVHDDDAPTGSGFWHWTVYDIPAGATGIAPGAGSDPTRLPSGARNGANDFYHTGVAGADGNYGGPCPPAGDTVHHYVFTLYALGVEKIARAASLPVDGSPALYGFALNRGLGAAMLGKTSLTATYSAEK